MSVPAVCADAVPFGAVVTLENRLSRVVDGRLRPAARGLATGDIEEVVLKLQALDSDETWEAVLPASELVMVDAPASEPLPSPGSDFDEGAARAVTAAGVRSVASVLRAALRSRSSTTWSVTVGAHSQPDWLRLNAPKSRRTFDEAGTVRLGRAAGGVYPSLPDRRALAALLGLSDPIPPGGLWIPPEPGYHVEYLLRAHGLEVPAGDHRSAEERDAEQQEP